ncbi:MAG TPA: Mur ligase family protein [Dehalococcoidia bacterium]|jgi:dihydrofolate synthase/folylpolyglutamate synthase|nr:Mur ligase family protein [Dehalococcoidia bacterium]
MSKINNKYKSTINSLLSLTDFEREKNIPNSKIFHLKRIKNALELLGNPQNTPKFTIHIAGTNGKGSISSLIHSALTKNGLKCGLYTSPHLHNFRERIKVGNNLISMTDFCNIYEKITKTTSSFFKNSNLGTLTVFETLTIMGAIHFKNSMVEVQIIETGLGGTFDSTNIFNSNISILTPISLDHTKILGETLEKITRDKVGIIKNNSIVISSKQKPKILKIIKEKALEKKSTFIDVEENLKNFNQKYQSSKLHIKLSTSSDSYKIKHPLIGINQLINVSTAITCLENFNLIKLDKKNTITGLEGVKWPCRGEIIKKDEKLFLIDGAHNPSACRDLVKTINSFFKEKKILLIFGCNSDHHEIENIRTLSQLTENIILTQSRHPKSINTNSLKKILPFDNIVESQITKSVEESFIYSMKNKNNDLTVVTGSLFVAAEFRELLLDIEPEIYETNEL